MNDSFGEGLVLDQTSHGLSGRRNDVVLICEMRKTTEWLGKDPAGPA